METVERLGEVAEEDTTSADEGTDTDLRGIEVDFRLLPDLHPNQHL